MKNRLLVIAAFIAIAVSSCNKAGKTGLLVPKDAGVVIYVNTASLSSKLSWEEIKQSDWFKKMNTEVKDSFVAKILDNPDNSGVDIKAGFVFFLKNQSPNGYATLQGGIKDAAVFEQMVKSSKPGDIEIEKSGDLNIVKADNDAVLTWNKTKFIFVGNFPIGEMYGAAMKEMGGGRGNRSTITADSLVAFAKNVYSLKGKDLLDNNSKFADLIKSDGDVHLWASAEHMYSGMAGGVLSMMKISTLLQDNISTATLNFENGKISVNGKAYYGKEMAAIISKYPPQEVSKDVINRLPSGDVIAAGSFNYPTAGVIEIVKMIGADGILNSFLGREGISIEDVSKAFTGDFAFAVSDVRKKTDSASYEGPDGNKIYYPTHKTDPDFVVGIGVKDKTAFNKLYDILIGSAGGEVPKDITIKNESNWFVVSNSEANAGSFLKGNNKPSYAEKISGHGMGGYLNFQKLLSTFQSEVQAEEDSAGKASFDLTKATWQDAVMYGDYKSGTTSYTIEINMVDKTTNSLKQINKFADKMNAIQEAKRKKMMEEWPDMPAIDTTVVMPPALNK